MKPFIKERLNIILGILVVVLLYMYFFHPNIEEVKIPVEIEVPVPVVEKVFDTIKEPIPIYIPGKVKKEIDSTFYKKYIQLQDSIKKDSLFKEAIKIQEYKPFFEDDTIRIDVYAKVRGKLLEQGISYKTKPRTIKLDTVLTVPIPTRAKLFGGAGVRMPYNNFNPSGVSPIPYGGLYLKTKKDNLITLEFDTQSLSIGYAWKF